MLVSVIPTPFSPYRNWPSSPSYRVARMASASSLPVATLLDFRAVSRMLAPS